jgi:hypothetical protein
MTQDNQALVQVGHDCTGTGGGDAAMRRCGDYFASIPFKATLFNL